MTKKNSNDRQTNIRMVGDKIATPTPSYRTVRDQTEARDGMQSWPSGGRNAMKPSDTSFPFTIAQSAFEPARAGMRQAATGFWTAQDQMLDAMEEYTNAWFERRHTGAQDALDVAQQMIDAPTPVEALHQYQKWAIGCFERTFNDGLACQKQLLSIGKLLAPPLSPSSERTEAEPASGESRRRSQPRVAA